MEASGVLIPEDLASMGSPYVGMQCAGKVARRHRPGMGAGFEDPAAPVIGGAA